MTDTGDQFDQPVPRAYDHSRVRGGVSALHRVAADPEPAALRRRRAAVGRTLRLAGQYALVTRIARRCARTVRNARLYDWLTREPEHTVVVVDLTETWTVGPVIAVVDRLLDRFGGAGSSAARLGDSIRWVWTQRPVTVLAVLVTALLAVVWWFLWTAGSPVVPQVTVAMLAVAALLCRRFTVSASTLATPLSYRPVMGILLSPAGRTDDGMSNDDSVERPSTWDSTDAEDDSDVDSDDA